MPFVQRRRQSLGPIAFVQRHRAGRDVGDQREVQPDGQAAVPERRRHHPAQVVVEVGHQRLGALEGDDVAFPQAFRSAEVADGAAEAAVVVGQPVELPGDTRAGVAGDGQPPPQAGQDPADGRTPALDGVGETGTVAFGVEGEIGRHLGEPGARGVALEEVGHCSAPSTRLKIGPAMQTVNRTVPTATAARTDSDPTTLMAIASTAESQSRE